MAPFPGKGVCDDSGRLIDPTEREQTLEGLREIYLGLPE